MHPVSNDARAYSEINARIARATSAFCRLTKRLWTNPSIHMDTKVAVYKATVLSTLLYGCETWTLTAKQMKLLEKFHMTTLRKIARIRWFHKVPNTDVLSHSNLQYG